ncbi:Nucleoside-diphosphate-sugar epimerase [Filomicrobium insigne]|uniref:Nucleoside-diphosphate-sugar epimerase n=1 Tax=Filomicrobium insigne TaxID=418854 RepID=A0A1H0S9D5_9HYPH|nr:NAD(P)H-binding protein [Filomicrobium insigne]SDP37818.1 Nucleoside-diphosphate-sugar epimerase [Filomicrobium insigne]
MKVLIIGAAGGVGVRAAARLIARGHQATGLVRRREQVALLSSQGIGTVVGDVVKDSIETLAGHIRGHDALLFTAGAGGRDGSEATIAVDGDGPGKVAQAMRLAGVSRFYLVSVFPEAWRERRMDDDFEQYMVEKKKAETQIVLTELDWVVLRPSALTDEPGVGRVDLGLAKVHEEIRRDDVAGTLVALMERSEIRRCILEVTGGDTPIAEAVDDLRTR